MNDIPGPPPAGPAGAGAGALAGADYPIRVEADRQEEYVRLLPLIKWLLVIPHYFCLVFLYIGAVFVGIVAFFAVLFTARYPQGMWEYMIGVQRWALRVSAYAGFMTDQYPPFSLREEPGDPVRLHAEYPDRIARWRALVAWLLVIPYAIVAWAVSVVGSVMSFLAFFTILFTKQFPEGMFDVLRIAYNWQVRATTYGYFMVEPYPPFAWE